MTKRLYTAEKEPDGDWRAELVDNPEIHAYGTTLGTVRSNLRLIAAARYEVRPGDLELIDVIQLDDVDRTNPKAGEPRNPLLPPESGPEETPEPKRPWLLLFFLLWACLTIWAFVWGWANVFNFHTMSGDPIDRWLGALVGFSFIQLPLGIGCLVALATGRLVVSDGR